MGLLLRFGLVPLVDIGRWPYAVAQKDVLDPHCLGRRAAPTTEFALFGTTAHPSASIG